MSDPLDAVATAADIAAGVRTGAVSARAVVEAALARIEQGNRAINAFTAIAAARALERAKRIDTERRAGTPLGELAGVPFGVKAMIDVAGLTTTGGSALYRNAGAATRDAVVVRKLEAAGAVCVGALNMDEFGMGGTTENACFGPTRNPHDLARTPGGSSGGSAAAVAAGMVPITIGSDGLGSIRLPASLCGVFGLRPTRGAVSNGGVLGAGGTISTLGPLARSSRDIALCHRAVCAERKGLQSAPAASDAPIRLATAGGYFRDTLDDDAAEALRRVIDALGITREIEYPQAAPCARCGDARQCHGECRRQARRAAHTAGQVRSCDARAFSRACASAGAVVSRRAAVSALAHRASPPALRRSRRHRRTGDAVCGSAVRGAHVAHRRRGHAHRTRARLVHAADRRHGLSRAERAGRTSRSPADRRSADGATAWRGFPVPDCGEARGTRRRGRAGCRVQCLAMRLTPPSSAAELVVDACAEAGESPWWSAAEQCLYWVDIHGRRLHRFDPRSGIDRAWTTPDLVTFVATHAQGGLVVALRDSVCHVDLAAENYRVIARPSIPPSGRLNDGTVDARGRLLIGTMITPDASEASGALYRIDADGSCTQLLDGFRTVNGLAFAPDGRTLYVSDSHPNVRTIFACDYDPVHGAVKRRRVFVTTHDLPAARMEDASTPKAPTGWRPSTADACFASTRTEGCSQALPFPSKSLRRRPSAGPISIGCSSRHFGATFAHRWNNSRMPAGCSLHVPGYVAPRWPIA